MKMLPSLSLLASPRFTPRELIRMTRGEPEGLDLCIGGFRQVAWKDILAVAVVAVGRPTPEANLFLILRNQLRPFRVPASEIDFASFGLESKDSVERILRRLLIEVDRGGEHIAIPEATASFLRGEPVPRATEIELAALTTSWMAGIYPALRKELEPAPEVPEEEEEDEEGPARRSFWQGDDDSVPIFGPASPVAPPPLLIPLEQQIPYGPQREKVVLADLPERLAMAGREPRRRLALWGLAGLVTLLPVAYLGVVAALLFRVYRHAAEDGLALFAVGEEGERFLGIGDFFFLCPVGVLLLLAIAFIEPIFIGRRTSHRATVLQPDKEPVACSFVARVARLVGAEVPQVVEVTSDAGIGAEWRKRDGERQRVLTLGLPMVAGLSGRQLAMLLAGEMLVFRRRSDRRAMVWIRRIDDTLAALGARCEDLQRKRREGVGHLVRRLGLGAVVDFLLLAVFGLVRGLVFCLVFLSGQVRSLVDRWTEEEGRSTGRRLEREEEAGRREEWVEQLRAAQLETLFDGLAGEGAMPADHLPARGVLRALEVRAGSGGEPLAPYEGMPAPALFRDFSTLARQVTRDLLRTEAGGVAATEPLEDVLRTQSGEDAESEVRSRYFAETLLSWRPLPLPAALEWLPDPRPDGELVAELGRLRERFVEQAATHRTLLAHFDQAMALRISAQQAAELMRLGLDLDPSSFGLSAWDLESTQGQIHKATEHLRRVSQALRSHEMASGQRLLTALALVSSEERAVRLENAAERVREVGGILAGLAGVQRSFPVWLRLREALTVLGGVGKHLGNGNEDPEDWRARWIESWRSLQKELGAVPDLFHVGGLDFSAVIGGLPNHEVAAARDGIVRAHSFGLRGLGRLAALAEEIELAAGFEPLPKSDPLQERMPLPMRYPRSGRTAW